jgi:hypothetical protein
MMDADKKGGVMVSDLELFLTRWSRCDLGDRPGPPGAVKHS